MVKGLIVCDMDSTLIKEEGIDCLAHKVGKAEEVSALTRAAMEGRMDFGDSLKKRVNLLRGVDLQTVLDLSQQLTFTNGAIELLHLLRLQDFKIGIASGGFLQMMKPVLQMIKPDYILANSFEIKDHKLTGRLDRPIVSAQSKKEAALLWAQELRLSADQIVAIGDGANDIPLLQTAGIGIAFCAKEVVRNQVTYHIEEANLMKVWDLLQSLHRI
ncbi:phosphoserine phosphatase SerB [Streptococcus sp. DD13]|uniref:phosphoserine phosphatase SerB n=1 Tax=Streptococcus sp. DD13 TaxID=1777881 RepID=UPI00079AE0A9|nr:phosphoserine phosphatase SerB [Streptococcus sp. DD13]KXT79098.1 Phosphoserine phosphatase [Streptococcus sp. DD13]